MRYVNIIGAGLSGLSAAIALGERGVHSRLVSLQPSERAQSVLAEGGINAALDTMGEGDSPEEHFLDTMRGGCDLADPNAVEGLTYHAPELLRRLIGLGVPFNMEGKTPVLRSFGGQRHRRTAYARSSTGRIIMNALIDEARKYEAAGLIERLPHHRLESLLTEDGACLGARVTDTFTGASFELTGDAVLCTGGLSGIFPGSTTGTTANTGTAAAIAFAQGAELGDPEMIQYHPTTVGIPGKRCLISEAARGEGGRLFILRGGEPWYFMKELHPELGDLSPRDVVSREMFFVRRRPDTEGEVMLDMTGLDQKIWDRRLPDLRQEIVRFLGLDPAKAPVPVHEGIHYFMGGLKVDEEHRTSLPGLWAAGECACQYHGANRLGGNSMLGAIYGGRRAAESVLSSPGRDGELREIPPLNVSEPSPAQTEELARILLSGLGIVRCDEELRAALGELDGLEERTAPGPGLDRIRLGRAMLLGALERRESRGAHYRSDFPERDESLRKTTVARLRGGRVEISFESLPERRSRT